MNHAPTDTSPTLVVGDGDLVFLAGALVDSRHVHDAVSVDVERHLDLGDAPGSRRDARQLKLAQQVVVFGHGTLTFIHLLGGAVKTSPSAQTGRCGLHPPE